MRTFPFVLLLMASMACVLLGCSDKSGPLAASDDPTSYSGVSAPGLAKGEALKHFASGSAPVSSWDGLDGLAVPFKYICTFDAKESMDGNVTGTLHFSNPGNDNKNHATVIGLKVVDNKAKLEFRITSGPLAPLYGFTVVIDNGEGKNAEGPDVAVMMWFYVEGELPLPPLTSLPTLDQLFNMTPDDYIEFAMSLEGIYFPVYALQANDGGNIQVR